jgi:beta-glucosidase
VVFARDYESEDIVRPTLNLPNNQDTLISRVAAADPHTVVVVETGEAIVMPWLNRVPAVLEAWHPGERGGAAIAGTPRVWPPGDRHYDAANLVPAFPFGFGLSYTTFTQRTLGVHNGIDGEATADVAVTNTGKHARSEVVRDMCPLPSPSGNHRTSSRRSAKCTFKRPKAKPCVFAWRHERSRTGTRQAARGESRQAPIIC